MFTIVYLVRQHTLLFAITNIMDADNNNELEITVAMVITTNALKYII